MSITRKDNSPKSYYIHLSWQGKIYHRKTPFDRPQKYWGAKISDDEKKCSSYRSAQSWEKKFVASLRNDHYEIIEKSKLRQTYGTIQSLIDAWHQFATIRISNGQMKPRTAQYALQSFEHVLDSVGKKVTDSLNILDRDLAKKYQAIKLAENVRNPEKQEKSHTSINTRLRSAKQLFSSSALDYYKSINLSLPDCIDDFKKIPSLKERSHRFQGFTDDQITQINQLGEDFKNTDIDLYRAFLLLRYLGMRNGAILHARWDWITELNGAIVMNICTRSYYKPKTPATPTIHPTILADLKRPEGFSPDNYIVKPDSTRKDGSPAHKLIYRTLSRHIREIIPDRVKSSYELRKLAGSEILQKTGSADIASQYLGNSPDVFRNHYGNFGVMPSLAKMSRHDDKFIINCPKCTANDSVTVSIINNRIEGNCDCGYSATIS